MITVAHKWSYRVQPFFFITSHYKYLPLQVIQFILLKVNTFLHEMGSKSTIDIYMVTFGLLSM